MVHPLRTRVEVMPGRALQSRARALTGGALFATSAALIAPTVSAQTTLGAMSISNEVEAALVRVLDSLRDAGIKPALKEIDATLEKNPNFRLGHLIKGDLLMAKAGVPTAFGPSGLIALRSEPESQTSLREEARVRLTRHLDGPPPGSLPTALLQLAPHQRHALLVDSAQSRIYVFENADGMPQPVADFYISGGKQGFEKSKEGDQRTPLGVYVVTSSMGKEKLSDFYGPGAFPLNYPNEWDKRLGKNGSGIWIHGTPSTTYSRPPRASDGCVVLTNDDFQRFSRFVAPGSTPVVIVPAVTWKTPETWAAERGRFYDALSAWQRDWESLDMDRYLSHYSPRFETDGKDKAAWSEAKRRVNAAKAWVKVGVSNLSIYEYAVRSGSTSMMMVTFDQDYKSSNNATRMKKRQYWQLESGQWRIVYEGVATS
jgi:murein L,D-transpeptidase YafK